MLKLLREIRNLLKEIRDELRKSNEPVRFIDESYATELNENRKRAKETRGKSLKLLREFDDLLIEVRKN